MPNDVWIKNRHFRSERSQRSKNDQSNSFQRPLNSKFVLQNMKAMNFHFQRYRLRYAPSLVTRGRLSQRERERTERTLRCRQTIFAKSLIFQLQLQLKVRLNLDQNNVKTVTYGVVSWVSAIFLVKLIGVEDCWKQSDFTGFLATEATRRFQVNERIEETRAESNTPARALQAGCPRPGWNGQDFKPIRERESEPQIWLVREISCN